MAALLIFGISTTTWAQSSVTLYGIIDAGLTYVTNTGGHSDLIEDTGVMQANRWGLTGVEDLGGGIKALFTLENGFTLGNGALGQGGALFGRTASVGLSNRFGTLTMGRQYDFMYYLGLDASLGQFGGAYAAHVFDIDRLTGEQLNNTVKYVSPSFHGLNVGALYGFSNVAGQFGGAKGAPRAVSFGANYDGGPLVINLAYTDVNGTGGAASESLLNATAVRNYGIGGRYLYRSLTLFGNYTNNRISGLVRNAATTLQIFEGGFNWLATPSTSFGVGYSFTDWSYANYNQVNVAAHYFLSKSTDIYVSAYYQHSNSISRPAAIWLILNPGTNTGYSSNQNQLAMRVGMRVQF